MTIKEQGPEPSIASFHKDDLKQQIEALIFSSDEALPVTLIQKACEDKTLSIDRLEAIIRELNDDFEKSGRTFRIRKLAGGYRFLTEKQFHPIIQKLIQPKLQRRLSQSALEALSIIAYKQPVSKPEIEQIRGTASDYVVKVLLEKNLIEVTGRSDSPGKPLLYSTTTEFLDYFNIYSIDDLPKPREIEELLKENEEQNLLKSNQALPQKVVLLDQPDKDQDEHA